MTTLIKKSNNLNEKIEKVKQKILRGEISLLELELNPIFQELKGSINIFNLNEYSELYKEMCVILEQKFEELKIFLNLIDSDQLFLEFLNLEPSDDAISGLFEGCWRESFFLENVSLDYLIKTNEIYSKDDRKAKSITHLKKGVVDEEFIVEISKQNFTQNMLNYFNKIKPKLPCKFEHVFEEENDQLKIFENFMFLLHLLQLGKIKYQKETKSLYM